MTGKSPLGGDLKGTERIVEVFERPDAPPRYETARVTEVIVGRGGLESIRIKVLNMPGKRFTIKAGGRFGKCLVVADAGTEEAWALPFIEAVYTRAA